MLDTLEQAADSELDRPWCLNYLNTWHKTISDKYAYEECLHGTNESRTAR